MARRERRHFSIYRQICRALARGRRAYTAASLAAERHGAEGIHICREQIHQELSDREQLSGERIMDDNRALAIVSALANGVNPQTGEIFEVDSPYQSVDVIRAL